MVLANKGGKVPTATADKPSLRNHFLRRKMARLRRAACMLFQSDPLIQVLKRVEREVECGRLSVRMDRHLNLDLGM